ncbi:RING-type E3 ubiquitin transferase [Ranunculus cassubicifolius]
MTSAATPPSSSSYSVSQLSRTDYVLIMLGFTMALVVIYHLVFLKCCPQRESINGGLLEEGVVRNNNAGVLNLHAIPCKVYKKEGEVQDSNNECAVCLCCFVDGEDQIRQLPLCKHYFHSSCIDMWLLSHMNCPICRAKVVMSRANSRGLGEEEIVTRDILPV